MGREVRRVPANWQHPKDGLGHFIPLLLGPFEDRLREWLAGEEKWNAGLREDYKGGWKPLEGKELSMSYTEWTGRKPVSGEYMPSWPSEKKTHLMMYETCTEGTPISPAFATPEELARWLTDNEASAFGGQTATYEQWLSACKQGWAPTAVLGPNGLESGIAASARINGQGGKP